MASTRVAAVGLLFIAAFAYAAAAVPIVLGGAFYPWSLGGQVALRGAAWVLLAGSAVIAVVIPVALRRRQSERVVAALFAARLVVAAVAAISTGPVIGACIALTAMVPLALVRPDRRGRADADA